MNLTLDAHARRAGITVLHVHLFTGQARPTTAGISLGAAVGVVDAGRAVGLDERRALATADALELAGGARVL